ncbi:uncharacterized protein FPRO_14807 [Fusarium proliferatum ET1]|uniref:Uncharacterized protein n=1 Tax=Fusarium proliferatum (strain ET1) TaxID=1227346 RepID=A0A1L7WAR3_FUSPR|nr:uncharacterized protein FPRO_14807 [Fusarium proliferatum ET1]CZR49715.1 uncharacterized protein FPRO_14807 [Fusarium proliferatum ET1]
MCYFEQTRRAFGYWRWGHFRQQCNKEYRMGETCGLKLVYETRTERDVCKLCHDTEKKQRRYDKMYRDVQRWQREGNRNATIERTCAEMQEALGQIYLNARNLSEFDIPERVANIKLWGSNGVSRHDKMQARIEDTVLRGLKMSPVNVL